jgi:maltose O-acetyltransferase
MLAGELYQPGSPQLTRERAHAKDLCFQLNQTHPSDTQQRFRILKKLFNPESANDFVVETPFHCDYGYNICLGGKFYSNHGCTILDANRVSIGNGVMLGPNVVITTAHHPLGPILRTRGDELAHPVVIGDNVWIGANATILPGVSIGRNVVVGAGAVVNRHVPDNVVVVGAPARIVRRLGSEDEIFDRESP